MISPGAFETGVRAQAALFYCLAHRRNMAVSYNTLFEALAQANTRSRSKTPKCRQTIAVYMSHLRAEFNARGRGETIVAVHRFGYMLISPAEEP